MDPQFIKFWYKLPKQGVYNSLMLLEKFRTGSVSVIFVHSGTQVIVM